MIFLLSILFVGLLRGLELFHSKKNEKWLRQNGAVEYGEKHYKLIVALHVLFFVSLIIEYSLQAAHTFNELYVILFLLIISIKGWVITSLVKYWNTKILRVPNAPLVKKGPYKYIKHPNYLIVIIEIIVIPLIFNLYYTAILFSILNAIVLTIRIREENQALKL